MKVTTENVTRVLTRDSMGSTLPSTTDGTGATTVTIGLHFRHESEGSRRERVRGTVPR